MMGKFTEGLWSGCLWDNESQDFVFCLSQYWSVSPIIRQKLETEAWQAPMHLSPVSLPQTQNNGFFPLPSNSHTNSYFLDNSNLELDKELTLGNAVSATSKVLQHKTAQPTLLVAFLLQGLFYKSSKYWVQFPVISKDKEQNTKIT